MNTVIRKLPQGLGAGFAKGMPAPNAKHVELMRLLDSQVDEHLGWATDEPPVPSQPAAADPDPDPAVEPVRNDDPTPSPTEWPDTVLDPSSVIAVAFTEPNAAPASAPMPAASARVAWPLMRANLPWVVLFFASIPLTVWLTLQWSDPTPGAPAAVVEKPQAEPAAKPAHTAIAAAAPANPAPARAAASQLPVVAAAQSNPGTAVIDAPVVHDDGVVAEAAAAPTQAPLQPSVPPAATPSRPIDPAACAESRAALGLCGTPHGPSTTSPGVKP
jgi:hypothetical protein